MPTSLNIFRLVILSIAISLSGCATNAHFIKGTLVISDGPRRIYIPKVSPPTDEAPTPPVVHAVQKRGASIFVVISKSQFTRGYPARGGHCGSGTESFLEWFHILNGKVTERTHAHYESCPDSREGRIEGWQGPLLRAVTSYLLENDLAAGNNDIRQTIVFTFDATRPEQGLKEEKVP